MSEPEEPEDCCWRGRCAIHRTPGPWTVGKNNEILYGSGRYNIVETDSGVYPPGPADARLIAAAPEMLAALQAVAREDRQGAVQFLTNATAALVLEAITLALHGRR